MQRELLIDAATGDFEIRPVSDRLIGPVDYGWARFKQDPGSFCWGGGPLAGSRIPGTRRLVFTGYSPAWEGFYISSLGGGAYVGHRVGVDFVCLRGQCPVDSVLILNHHNGEIHRSALSPSTRTSSGPAMPARMRPSAWGFTPCSRRCSTGTAANIAGIGCEFSPLARPLASPTKGSSAPIRSKKGKSRR